MKRTKTIVTLSLIVSAVVILQSCQKDDDDPKANDEFIADNSTFAGFESWSLDASNTGPDPALGSSHGGNDSTVTRNVYFKDGQNMVNGTYPIGTVVVKYSKNPGGTVNEITAMVKRGNNFNPNIGDWEFFVLMPDGSIANDQNGVPLRGAAILNGMCGSCHTGAASKDFIFSKN